jgi:hypothetical protein
MKKVGYLERRYWETDEGGVLIHEKGLEMVHNIYDELDNNPLSFEREERDYRYFKRRISGNTGGRT